MPFTPKFFDLVRNSTTITGTGPVTLGSAVTGFSSLAAVLGTGDQFYYCIQGVDKPQEREVGRGTMQANGTIARQPIAGSATNFTTGAKTIAMVAAAEWFARLEGMASGGGASAFDVATRSALAARPLHSGGAQLTEPGREGLFTFNPANLSAAVTADPRQGLYVAPASDPSGATGAWERTLDGAVNVQWFGAVGDGVSDDLPAFNAALAALKALAPAGNRALFKSSPKLYMPTTARHYYLNGTLNLFQQVHLYGDGSGAPNSFGTTLRFGDNCNGIVFNDYRTNNDGLGSIGDASGSLVEGLCLFGGNMGYNPANDTFVLGDGSSATGHGIRIRATGCKVKDIQFQFWAGDAINILAYSGSGGATEGNANNWLIENIWAFYCDGNGLFVEGNDANAGSSINFNAVQCRLFGILDKSFLGNTHMQPHVRDCGLYSSTGLNLPTSVASYGGNYYSVVWGKDVAASTTVPGTNPSVWSPGSAHPGAKPWVSGMAWTTGGPYAAVNANAFNLFLNAYSESGQGPIMAEGKALFLGGLLAYSPIITTAGDPGGTWVYGGGESFLSRRFMADNGTSIGGASLLGFDLSVTGGGGLWKMVKNTVGGKLAFTHNNSDYFSFDSGDGNYAGAFTAFRLRLSRPNNGVLGGINQELGFVNATSQINGRVVVAGDHYLNYAPVLGGNTGWVVTTSGTVGTGAVLTPSGIVGGVQAAAQADTTAADLVALKGDFNALLAKLRTARLLAP